MNKRIFASALLGLILVAPAQADDSKEISRSHEAAKRYLSKCKSEERIVSIGKLGHAEINRYWKTVPELKKVREKFLKANAEMSAVLQQDPEYKKAMADFERPDQTEKQRQANWKKAKHAVFQRMASNSDYRKTRKAREKALYECNIETLEYIINDYIIQEKPFPIEKLTGRN